MYCKHCGSPMAENVVFCSSCGANNAEPKNTQGQPSQPAQGQPQYYQPSQYNQPPYPEQKSKLVAGLLQILIGGLGIGRFYLGYTKIGAIQIIVTFCTCGIGAIWPLIDGIMILTGSVAVDANGVPLKD